MKPFKPTTLIILLLLTANATVTFAQDSLKKAKPVAVKAVATKAPVKYNPYAAKPAYKTPVTPIAQTPGATAVTPQLQRPATDPALLTDKSLNGQYQYLLTKVYNYQRPLISALWKNYNDTLNVTRKKLKEVSAKVATQTATIDTLQKEATAKDQTLSASNAHMDEVSLLGMPVTKATYNWIMWGLVIGFGVIAAIVIARSGSNNREAKYRIKLYNELEEEFKTYKTKANEKEKKLARELQTERNKLDELRGNA